RLIRAFDKGEDIADTVVDTNRFLNKFEDLNDIRKTRPRAGVDVGEYRKVRGHHVHAQAGFEGHVLYDPQKGFSISQEYMKGRGWRHERMTVKQRQLFDELAKSGRPNTLREHTNIAVAALKEGGATTQEARDLVSESLRYLRRDGVRNPTRIPWND
ncbi:MAG: hypothetical protein JW725_05220, partial [Candidatus Babeliaceae bacterium]|nr:hypothetical protein [Candidatus Babeliaceae bacterium]